MSFRDEFDAAQAEIGGSDYFKFKEGENRLRILAKPVRKITRFGYGICYAGAAYCQAAAMTADYEKAKQEAIAAGKDASDVSQPTLSLKWACWAVDRATKKVVNVELTNKMMETIISYMESEEGKFTEWPMPYDVIVTAKGAGQKSVKYSMIAARSNTPVTEEELELLGKQTPMDQIIEKMKAKKREKDGVPAPTSEAAADAAQEGVGEIKYPEDEINPEDIPF